MIGLIVCTEYIKSLTLKCPVETIYKISQTQTHSSELSLRMIIKLTYLMWRHGQKRRKACWICTTLALAYSLHGTNSSMIAVAQHNIIIAEMWSKESIIITYNTNTYWIIWSTVMFLTVNTQHIITEIMYWLVYCHMVCFNHGELTLCHG